MVRSPAQEQRCRHATLYSYPELFSVADNKGYGLKVFAFLKLAGVPFVHAHLFDASRAPRGQLPFVSDDGEDIGDSETIIAHVIRKCGVTPDAGLSEAQRDRGLMTLRFLDDLYSVIEARPQARVRRCSSRLNASASPASMGERRTVSRASKLS